MARTETIVPNCDLCARAFPAGENPDDFRCHGCHAYVCERHHGDPPFGRHSPEQHLSEYDPNREDDDADGVEW